MTNKLTHFLLEHFPDIMEKTREEIEKIENEMVGQDGKIKKAELDKRILDYVSGLIRNWDIPQVPNIVEDNILDPATIKMIEISLPPITQKVYDVSLVAIKKIKAELI